MLIYIDIFDQRTHFKIDEYVNQICDFFSPAWHSFLTTIFQFETSETVVHSGHRCIDVVKAANREGSDLAARNLKESTLLRRCKDLQKSGLINHIPTPPGFPADSRLFLFNDKFFELEQHRQFKLFEPACSKTKLRSRAAEIFKSDPDQSSMLAIFRQELSSIDETVQEHMNIAVDFYSKVRTLMPRTPLDGNKIYTGVLRNSEDSRISFDFTANYKDEAGEFGQTACITDAPVLAYMYDKASEIIRSRPQFPALSKQSATGDNGMAASGNAFLLSVNGIADACFATDSKTSRRIESALTSIQRLRFTKIRIFSHFFDQLDTKIDTDLDLLTGVKIVDTNTRALDEATEWAESRGRNRVYQVYFSINQSVYEAYCNQLNSSIKLLSTDAIITPNHLRSWLYSYFLLRLQTNELGSALIPITDMVHSYDPFSLTEQRQRYFLSCVIDCLEASEEKAGPIPPVVLKHACSAYNIAEDKLNIKASYRIGTVVVYYFSFGQRRGKTDFFIARFSSLLSAQ